jgi:hypothetical protein
VVFNNDAENHRLQVQAKNANGDLIPELELKFRILPNVLANYELLKNSNKSFACAGTIKQVESHVVSSWLERMAIERLERKTEEIKSIYELSNNDWQETFYRLLAKNFGFKTNADAFYLLTNSLPLAIVAKHKNDLFQVESLLFGQAGLLDDYLEEPYAKKLQNEYTFLKKKYSLTSIQRENWKYLRMRPVNFPTVRIAQFASLMTLSSHLFSKALEEKTQEGLKKLFSVTASEFWDTHYSFTSTSPIKAKALGSEAIENILINTVAPLLFFYGKQKNEEQFVQRAIDVLEAIDAEDNKVVREYKNAGANLVTAIDSQGILNLNKFYCKQSACLKCAIGNAVLKN